MHGRRTALRYSPQLVTPSTRQTHIMYECMYVFEYHERIITLGCSGIILVRHA
jgi:hypothetical protein